MLCYKMSKLDLGRGVDVMRNDTGFCGVGDPSLMEQN